MRQELDELVARVKAGAHDVDDDKLQMGAMQCEMLSTLLGSQSRMYCRALGHGSPPGSMHFAHSILPASQYCAEQHERFIQSSNRCGIAGTGSHNNALPTYRHLQCLHCLICRYRDIAACPALIRIQC